MSFGLSERSSKATAISLISCLCFSLAFLAASLNEGTVSPLSGAFSLVTTNWPGSSWMNLLTVSSTMVSRMSSVSLSRPCLRFSGVSSAGTTSA